MALRLAAGNSHELLSTPTHQFGWIDTRVFVKRLKDYVTRPECYDNPDRVLALSRLSLEHRNAALAKLPKSDDEYIEAVRYALGAGDVTIGPTPGYWISAARARSPFTDDEKVRAVHPGYGADAALTALYHVSPDSSVKMLRGSSFVPAKLKIQRTSQAEPQPAHIDMPTVLLHFDNWSSFESPKLVVDWTASIWPAQQESVFAAPIPDLSQCIDQPGMLHNRQHFFAPLGRPGLRFGENARLLLMLGLCHKNPEVHLPAVDIAIAAVAENRFDAESFGMTLRTLFKLDFARPVRLAKQLAEIARQSILHTATMRNLLEHTLTVTLKADHNPLLELLLELCVESRTPVQSTALREILSLRYSGKAGKIAKKLLQ